MAPEKLGKYELRGELGRGAAGTVWDAWDPVINRRVAIKTVKLPNANDEEAMEELGRFRREAQAAGNLQHPNIVAIFDYGETGELAYIVMEVVNGGSLKGVIDKQGQVPAADAARFMDEVLAGLAFSHERGIVHRDIKPANIMLDDRKRVKIADFGIARIEGSSATMVGTMLGTPAYMSPEQWRGDAHIDARSDIYACGVLMYHMLTGKRPFEGSQQAIMHKVFNETAVPPSQVSMNAPESLDWVVLKAIARNAEDRFHSAEEFAEAIKSALAGGGPPPEAVDNDHTVIASARRSAPAAAPAPAPAPAPKPAAPAPAKAEEKGGSKLGLIIGAVAGVVVIGGGVGAWLLLGGDKPAPPKPTVIATPNTPTPSTSTPVAPPPVAPPPVAPPPVAPPAVPASPIAPPSVATPTQVTPPPVTPTPVTPTPVTPTQVTPVAPTPATPAVPAPLSVLPPVVGVREVASIMNCSAVYGDASANRLALAGVAAAEQIPPLREAYDRTQAATRSWNVLPIPPLDIYCAIIDQLRPYLRQVGEARGVTARIVPSPTTGGLRLKDNEPIDFDFEGPDFASNLLVDYVGADGSVSHYMPRKANPPIASRRLTPGTKGRLFGKPTFTVGPPFGTDLVIFVASSEPITVNRAADDEQIAASLPALRAALDAAQRRGVRISVELVPVESVEK